jgi:hypothetical protein
MVEDIRVAFNCLVLHADHHAAVARNACSRDPVPGHISQVWPISLSVGCKSRSLRLPVKPVIAVGDALAHQIGYAAFMQHQLRITIDGAPVKLVSAETSLGPSPQLGMPEFFHGKLLRLSPEQVLEIKFAKDVMVGFEGWSFKFSKLEKDGTFELTKAW